MSYSNKKRNLNEIDGGEFLLNVFKIVLIIASIWGIIYFYFNVVKPKERKYINHSKYAYAQIQEELTKFYKEKGYIYNSKDDINDEFCEVLRKKYSPYKGTCNTNPAGGHDINVVFKKGNITIYGMEKPPFEFEGNLVKDFYIDINGEKGENTMGIDRLPLRIYSKGLLGGIVTPVNCSVYDYKEYGIPLSPICQTGTEINFLNSNKPLSFRIKQIGSNEGKSRFLGKNISFARADCAAFGAELMGFDELCEKRGFHWLTGCYHEYTCAIELDND